MDEQAERVMRMLTCFTDVDDVIKAERMTRTEFEMLCHAAFDMEPDEAVETFAAQGRAKVHAAQVQAALDGNNSMLLLLGKQYLGQSEETLPVARPDIDEGANPFERIIQGYADAPDRKSRAAN